MKWKIIIIDLGQIKKNGQKVIQIKSSCELLMKWVNEEDKTWKLALNSNFILKDN